MNKGFLIFCLIILILIPITWYLRYKNAEEKSKQENFQRQIGTYTLDIHKTFLGGYNKDSNLYQKLCITFNPDSTFYMNMKVPFIYDSVGKWQPGGGEIDEWNWLQYKSNMNISTQFTSPFTIDSISQSDSFFYMNSTTPKKGASFIQKIYFKKVSR